MSGLTLFLGLVGGPSKVRVPVVLFEDGISGDKTSQWDKVVTEK